MSDLISVPSTGKYCLNNVNLSLNAGKSKELKSARIFVENGLISQPHDGLVIDAKGAMLLPAFVDMHTHLDKGHISPRADQFDGTFDSAIETVQQDREANWNAEDVRCRMNFALKCAYAHGTRAIRTHIDSIPPQHKISWPVFDEIRDEWEGRIELQASTLFAIDLVDDYDSFIEIADLANKFNGILGCVTYPMSGIDQLLNKFFKVAIDRQMDVDFHVDESLDPNADTLDNVALAAINNGYQGSAVAGHCCSLSCQDQSKVDRTFDLLKEAKMSIVSLPMCNMFLQDRVHGHTPRFRGVTLVHEMHFKDIPVAFASDNTRDPFYAYGDLDMLEVMREATRICHLDDLPSWHETFNFIPAQICNFSKFQFQVADPADFIIFRARNWSELMSRAHSDRIVIRNGIPINTQLPNYSELDDLMVKS